MASIDDLVSNLKNGVTNLGNIAQTLSNALPQVFGTLVSYSGSIRALGTTAPPSGGTAGAGFVFFSTPNFGVFGGTGTPTLAAATSSLYLRLDASSATTRVYVNTNGASAWTSLPASS
jgi:hypothetical protein